MDQVFEFLKEAKTFYLATVEEDQPRVRPFGAVALYEGKVYIQTGKVKNVSKQLHANPKAEICAFSKGKWLRVSGKLIPDESIEAKKYMLDENPGLRRMYDENDDNTEVLYFEDMEAILYSFTSDPEKLV